MKLVLILFLAYPLSNAIAVEKALFTTKNVDRVNEIHSRVLFEAEPKLADDESTLVGGLLAKSVPDTVPAYKRPDFKTVAEIVAKLGDPKLITSYIKFVLLPGNREDELMLQGLGALYVEQTKTMLAQLSKMKKKERRSAYDLIAQGLVANDPYLTKKNLKRKIVGTHWDAYKKKTKHKAIANAIAKRAVKVFDKAQEKPAQ